MPQKQLSALSPIHLLRRNLSGGLSPGKLGVTMARAGVGKTAFLVQIGLNALLQERNVLHVALGQNTDHVRSWYDTLFDDLVSRQVVENAAGVGDSLFRHLVIQTYAEHMVASDRLQHTIDLYRDNLQFSPDVILLDGFDWEDLPPEDTRPVLEAFLACAGSAGSELWMSAQTHRATIEQRPAGITPPCEPFEDLIDVAFFLEPEGRHVSVRIVKDHDQKELPDTHLLINCDTLSLAADTEQTLKLPADAYTLLSGGAPGAEAAFGECAERYGLQEINFSFEGHKAVRSRGLVKLSMEELELGNVSDKYIAIHMRRTYPRTPLFQKVLQSIWHQVNTAGEVFVAGKIMDDNTVKGGTGWAAELARHWHKPLYVYDQDRNNWFFWQDAAWVDIAEPRVTRTRFTGNGTRFLTDQGRKAIKDLFDRSFG